MTARRWYAAASAMLALSLFGCASGTPTGSSSPNASATASAPATGRTTAPTTKGAGPDSNAALKLNDLPMPETGTYAYSVAIDLGPDNSHGGERKLSYYAPSVTGAGADQYVRQTTAFTGSQPKEWWFHYRWRSDGFYEIANVQPEGSTCLLNRPMLVIEFPVRVGASWHSEATCGYGTTYKLDAKVLRTESVTIQGTTVTAYVIDRTVSRGSDYKETWWFAPGYGINVKARQQGTGSSELDLKDTVRALEPSALPSNKPPSGF